MRHRVSNGIGYVDGRRTLSDSGIEDLYQVVEIAARCIFGRELDVLTEVTGDPDGVDRLLEDLRVRLPKLMLQVDVRGGNEGVDSGLASPLDRLPRTFNVLAVGARERRDRGLPDLTRNRLDRLEVPLRSDRKTGFNDVDVESLELPGHLQFLFEIHRTAGGLFAIAQRGIEDVDFI